MLKPIYLAGGVRTPIGSFLGSLSEVKAGALGAHVVRASLERAGVDPRQVDEVYMGNVIGAGLGQNVARQATLGAGLPKSVGATTISKVCGSGLRAVIHAAQAIQCEDLHLAVAGGTESMSNAPYLLPRARTGYRMGNGELIDAMIHDGLWDVYTNQHMGNCGDLCANRYGITREQMDDFSIESFRRAIAAWENGLHPAGVAPIEVKTRKGTVTVERDEGLAKYQGEEKLRSLKPAFGADSKITAGNASGIADGAAALVVFDEETKDRLGLKPRARILGHANAATDPEWFTIAPVHALRKLSERLDLKLGDVDLFEINEAFAVVTMVAIKELGLDAGRVNVAGGAVALGHPIGATGARILVTLLDALERMDKRIGVACLCIGGGEATAVAVERCG
ncbi:MAG: thiolase family protein [Planctomycetota bacterium]|nr:MAG: thiolase family protein [Planctomycetota bacterium]